MLRPFFTFALLYSRLFLWAEEAQEGLQNEYWVIPLWINVSTDTVKEPIFVQIGGGKDFLC